ncbi:MAG: hypothetical protein AAGF24_01380 [Cyanobacteria bacterium P01_H01_bin.121]
MAQFSQDVTRYQTVLKQEQVTACRLEQSFQQQPTGGLWLQVIVAARVDPLQAHAKLSLQVDLALDSASERTQSIQTHTASPQACYRQDFRVQPLPMLVWQRARRSAAARLQRLQILRFSAQAAQAKLICHWPATHRLASLRWQLGP